MRQRCRIPLPGKEQCGTIAVKRLARKEQHDGVAAFSLLGNAKYGDVAAFECTCYLQLAMTGRTFDMSELQKLSGVPARTIRYWIRMRLLPRPSSRGRSARYSEDHLLRVRVIQHLRANKHRITKIATQLRTLTRPELEAMLPPAPRGVVPAITSEPGAPIPETDLRSYGAVPWDVIRITKGLTLLVNPNEGPTVCRMAEEICRLCSEALAQQR
jgi:DNA-binding transcriptional MerR regulator